MGIFVALVPLIVALLPYLEKAIEWLIERRKNNDLRPRQQRRVGILLGHVGRLRQKCEEFESHGAAIGCVAEEGEIGGDDDDT